ncbi:MAG: hypothetical protein Fur0044_41970 [Anaerolineae bacterium]
MELSKELQALQPIMQTSPLPGFEYVRGFGVFGLPLESGHVLALRVFPENSFAPYMTVWHRTPEGVWSIFVDGPRLDTACPRYYGAAARYVQFAKITLRWTGPMALTILVDSPRLEWHISMASSPLFDLMNTVSPRLPEPLWRTPLMLRAFEWLGKTLFDLGNVTLTGTAPNGHFTILMPQRMLPITSGRASLNGQDLGRPSRSPENPAIGSVNLPARPVFAIGRAYFKIQDPVEYERTIAELRLAPTTL